MVPNEHRSSLFPHPYHMGPGRSCTRWRLSDLLAYEAASTGETPPALAPLEERYLSVKQVAERYGASVPTIWRWTKGRRGRVRV